MQIKGIAFRKHTQIAMANRTMFLWVAFSSVILGFALVGAIFLVQVLIFNEKVLHVKSQTVKTLETNKANIDELEKEISLLRTNQALKSAKAYPSDETVQVILDALPSEANPDALGSSIQEKLLGSIGGLSLDSFKVDPMVGSQSLTNGGLVQSSSSTSGPTNEITFSFIAIGDDGVLRQVLENFEKSIRTIDIISFKIESQGSERSLSVQGRAYYEPARLIELKEITVE